MGKVARLIFNCVYICIHDNPTILCKNDISDIGTIVVLVEVLKTPTWCSINVVMGLLSLQKLINSLIEHIPKSLTI